MINIELFKPNHDEKEIEAVSQVLKTNWWGLGAKTKEFEEKFAKKIGVKHAIGVNSCTAALQLAVNSSPKFPVIVPAISFIATAFAPMLEGRQVYFADVEEDFLTIDKESVEKIKDKEGFSKYIIIPVHLYGNVAETNFQNDFVIEDCAHACGTSIMESIEGVAFTNRMAGSLGDISCFSFHAVKNLACGDGGMVCTDDDEIAKRLRKQRWFGINKSTFDRSDSGLKKTVYGWEYDIDDVGYKMHINDIASSIGLVQLEKLDDGNKRRREIAEIYSDQLKHEDWIKLPKKQYGTESAQHIYAIRTEKRDGLNIYLKEKGIATGVHYKPQYQYSYFNGEKPKCPVAEREWKKLLSLPCYPGLTELEQEFIIDRIKEFGRK